MLDAVVGLPDQLFYNTGIHTYIWIVTNRKRKGRKGKVQLINATEFAWKMKKSLGNKRKQIGDGEEGRPNHIETLTKLYGESKNNRRMTLRRIKTNIDTERDPKKAIIVSKVFNNREFGYLKITVERPLRLNFAVTDERIERFKQSAWFQNLAASKKRKDKKAIAKEVETGKALQAQIEKVLRKMRPAFTKGKLINNREAFEALLIAAFADSPLKLDAPLRKALLVPGGLAERDPEAEICCDKKGHPEPDPELRDTENVPFPKGAKLPLPLDYEGKGNKGKVDKGPLLELMQDHCEAYLAKEVLPYRPDAWIDHGKIKVGYEIPFNRHFYQYQPPRPLAEIEAEITTLEKEIVAMLAEITA